MPVHLHHGSKRAGEWMDRHRNTRTFIRLRDRRSQLTANGLGCRLAALRHAVRGPQLAVNLTLDTGMLSHDVRADWPFMPPFRTLVSATCRRRTGTRAA